MDGLHMASGEDTGGDRYQEASRDVDSIKRNVESMYSMGENIQIRDIVSGWPRPSGFLPNGLPSIEVYR